MKNLSTLHIMKEIFITLLVIFNTVSSQKYASRLQSCWAQEGAKFDDCLLNLIQSLKDDFKLGIKDLGIPVLDPMHISNIHFMESASIVQIAATFKDVIVRGASDFNIVNVVSDLKNKKVKLDLTIPELKINGNYEISGTVLLLPIKGDGTFWLILTGITASGTGTLARVNNSVQITDMVVDFKVQTIRLRLNNLFGGDIVGDAVNQALNDNSQQVLDDIKPKIGVQLSEAVKKILNDAFVHLPPEAFNL